ncbi:MAG: DUF108 domain-containing protein [Alphaproteobacteria bacterium]|nr:DUF108 domain-containing protein [Alphaproteobacteria bacterium]
MEKSVGIAGMGAIGSAVAKALLVGIPGYRLTAYADKEERPALPLPRLDFDTLCRDCDLIIEALPATAVPDLMQAAHKYDKDVIAISSAALLIFPEIMAQNRSRKGRILVPSGALCGIDGVRAMRHLGITSARIASTKPPRGYHGAPYVVQNEINLEQIKVKTRLFTGHALAAAKAFPANVNVAATLSLAGIGAEKTQVEIWADPEAVTNSHEIFVESAYSKLQAKIENSPDPANPKSSMLAAQSIVALLHGSTDPVAVV